jgi:hypothetical protein
VQKVLDVPTAHDRPPLARPSTLVAGSAGARAAPATAPAGEAVPLSSSRNVLVVSTVEDNNADVLRPYVGAADTIKVVVPVVRQGVLDWIANDEKAFGEAEEIALRTADQLPGDTTEAVAGEPNVELAIRDALATFPADEIVVAVRPEQQEGLIEGRATQTAPRRSFDGVPVRYVVVPD